MGHGDSNNSLMRCVDSGTHWTCENLGELSQGQGVTGKLGGVGVGHGDSDKSLMRCVDSGTH